jgi:hypothetical protein
LSNVKTRLVRIARPAVVVGAVGALVASLLVAVSAPASAAGPITVASTGTLGIAMPITVTTTPPSGVGANTVFVTFSPASCATGGQLSDNLNNNGVAVMAWTPFNAGTCQLTASNANGALGAPVSVTINPATTTTTVTAPTTAAVNQAVTLTATVASQGGSQSGPVGSVRFAIQNGAVIAPTVPLNGAMPSVATFNWTPTTTGTFNIIATYTPANSAFSCGNACASAPVSVAVTPTGSNVGLVVPPMYQGQPVNITAQIFANPSAGNVAFTANGTAIGGPVAVGSNNAATVSYTPPAQGATTIVATWTGSNGATGTATQAVTVLPPGSPDTITVDPNGDAAPWTTNPANPVTAGQYNLITRTASGAPVTLAVSGSPCSLAGTVLTVSGASGSCTLTASSAGGHGYAPATNTYTLNIGQSGQTASLAAPPSQNIRRGRTITLATPRQGETNAGEEIEWSVTAGANRCRLIYPANGAVRMNKVRAGRCTVVGEAPATGGFGPFFIQRRY